MTMGTFRIIGETNFPFLKYRRVALTVSLLIILGGLACELWGPGLNVGIDFEGGTQVTIKLQEPPDLAYLRELLSKLEVGTPMIQRFDEPEKNQILIRVENPEDQEGDFTGPILELLHKEFNADLGQGFDLNTGGAVELSELLAAADPDQLGGLEEERKGHYLVQAEAISNFRKQHAIITGMEQLDEIPELSDQVRAYLKGNVSIGAFSLLGAENVGPAVGADLRKQAILAIGFSLVGMLVYIWIRFQLPYGLGAVVALFHDVLITLSALSVAGSEINLPTIAAMLTLVGYSVNDTVVVFDRMRENLRLNRGEDLETLMNDSLNQVLSRTLITSLTTFLVVLSLFLFGGDVIHTFSFVLLVGIIVGTYSSIFVASPVALFVSRIITRRRKARLGK